MNEDLRRQADVMLVSLDKRLALLEQAYHLGTRAEEARAKATERQIDGLTTKVESAIALWQNVTAEASASPAGRALVADLEAVTIKVDEHEAFILQTSGAIKLARFAVGASLLAFLGTALQIALALSGQAR